MYPTPDDMVKVIVTDCPNCTKGRCLDCGGSGQIQTIEGTDLTILAQQRDHMRDVVTIQLTGQNAHRLDELIKSGYTFNEVSRACEQARFQGRVDVHIEQIVQRMLHGTET